MDRGDLPESVAAWLESLYHLSLNSGLMWFPPHVTQDTSGGDSEPEVFGFEWARKSRRLTLFVTVVSETRRELKCEYMRAGSDDASGLLANQAEVVEHLFWVDGWANDYWKQVPPE